MPNFFKRNQDDNYEIFKVGSFSNELKKSIDSQGSLAPTKAFFTSFGRFLAVFLVVFSVVLTGYWLWRDNGVTNSPVVNQVVSQEETGAKQTANAATISSLDPQEIATATETDIVETGILIEATLWSLIAWLVLFTCLATMSHRLMHSLIGL